MSEDSFEEKALELIKSRPNGVLQSDLWKDLDIDSRKCSRVIAKLEADGKIKRTWETVKGTRTYRISYMPQKKEAPKKEVDFSLILVGKRIAPCIGCTYECEPDYCPDLGNWIELLARMPAQEAPKARAAPPVEEIKEPVEEEEHVVVAPVKSKKPAAKAKAPVKAAPPEEEEEEEKPAKAPAHKAAISAKSAAKVAPAKVAPAKVAPAKVAPAKVAPAKVAPAKVAPAKPAAKAPAKAKSAKKK